MAIDPEALHSFENWIKIFQEMVFMEDALIPEVNEVLNKALAEYTESKEVELDGDQEAEARTGRGEGQAGD